MAFVTLFVIGFIGSVFWIVNAETTAVYAAGEYGYHPVFVASILGLAQNVAYIPINHFGKQLTSKWQKLADNIERIRTRYGDKLKRRFLWITTLAALTGMPPVVAMVVLAPGFEIKMRHLFPVTLVCRFTRFLVLAWFGEALFHWWDAL